MFVSVDMCICGYSLCVRMCVHMWVWVCPYVGVCFIFCNLLMMSYSVIRTLKPIETLLGMVELCTCATSMGTRSYPQVQHGDPVQ